MWATLCCIGQVTPSNRVGSPHCGSVETEPGDLGWHLARHMTNSIRILSLLPRSPHGMAGVAMGIGADDVDC